MMRGREGVRAAEPRGSTRRPIAGVRHSSIVDGAQRVLALQRRAGNQAASAYFGGAARPTAGSLTVGPADDRYEREADTVAREVVRRLRHHHDHGPGPLQPSPAAPIGRIGRRAPIGAAGGALDAGTERAIERERGGGRPLTTPIRQRMESAFVSDFGAVRLHTGGRADALATRIQAQAFTLGGDVFLGAGAPALESPAGEELLAHELTHVIQQSGRASAVPITRASLGVGRRVQRKGVHFWNYVRHHVNNLDPANVPAHRNSLIAGWLLDQNIYELQSLLGSTQQVELLNLAKLDDYGFTVDDVVAFMRNAGAPTPQDGPEVHMAFLSQVMRDVPLALTTAVAQDSVAAGNQPVSLIRWMGLTPWGAGTGMMLHMLPGGIPRGSGPDSEPVWMKTVEQHHPQGQSTLYVRGHLLNHNIGGPGLDYNMVPITGKPAVNVGGNDANADHLHAIEKRAKDVWDDVEGGQLRSATYVVEPQYNRAPRAETQQVRAAEQQMRTLLDNEKATVVANLQGLPPLQLQQAWQNHTALAPIQGVQLTDQEKIAILAQTAVAAAEQANVGVLRGQNNPLMAAIDNAISAGLLDASVDGDADDFSLQDLYYLLQGNAATWEAEDRYIPSIMVVALESVDLNGATTTIGPLAVHVTLSTQVEDVYFRPKKTAEIA